LELFDTRIADVHVTSNIAEDLSRARIIVNLAIDGQGEAVTFEVSIDDQQGRSVGSVIQNANTTTECEVINVSFDLSHAELWWPAGHGEQPLYTARVKLLRKVCSIP
jgi:beta-mannosidase